jgi:hypothetical protein
MPMETPQSMTSRTDPNRGEHRLHAVRIEITRREEPRDEVVAHDVLGAVRVLRGIQRLGHRDALAPAVSDVRDHTDEQRVTLELQPERRAEGRDERKGNAPELDRVDPHEPPRLTALNLSRIGVYGRTSTWTSS